MRPGEIGRPLRTRIAMRIQYNGYEVPMLKPDCTVSETGTNSLYTGAECQRRGGAGGGVVWSVGRVVCILSDREHRHPCRNQPQGRMNSDEVHMPCGLSS